MEESDFSVGLLDMLVALTITCSDNVNEKLRFLTTLFDFNDDQFLAEEEVSERSERAFWKTSVLAMNLAKRLQSATSIT